MRKTLAALLGVAIAAGTAGVLSLPSGPGEPVKLPPVHVTIPADGFMEPPAVTVYKDGPVPDMNPPTQLHVRNVTEAECLDMGGKYVVEAQLCKSVDY